MDWFNVVKLFKEASFCVGHFLPASIFSLSLLAFKLILQLFTLAKVGFFLLFNFKFEHLDFMLKFTFFKFAGHLNFVVFLFDLNHLLLRAVNLLFEFLNLHLGNVFSLFQFFNFGLLFPYNLIACCVNCRVDFRVKPSHKSCWSLRNSRVYTFYWNFLEAASWLFIDRTFCKGVIILVWLSFWVFARGWFLLFCHSGIANIIFYFLNYY